MAAGSRAAVCVMVDRKAGLSSSPKRREPGAFSRWLAGCRLTAAAARPHQAYFPQGYSRGKKLNEKEQLTAYHSAHQPQSLGNGSWHRGCRAPVPDRAFNFQVQNGGHDWLVTVEITTGWYCPPF